ncbi:MAG: hypothetical protein AcusKO_22010 [Acuticoccus sp.]
MRFVPVLLDGAHRPSSLRLALDLAVGWRAAAPPSSLDGERPGGKGRPPGPMVPDDYSAGAIREGITAPETLGVTLTASEWMIGCTYCRSGIT